MEVAKAEKEPFNQNKLENWKTLSKELVEATAISPKLTAKVSVAFLYSKEF